MESKRDAFGHDTPLRMVGSETEYTTPFCGEAPFINYVSPDLVAYQQHDEDLWLKNGARFYIDTDNLIEYATPECRSASELLQHEKAGERLVEETVHNMAEYRGVHPADWHAYKRTSYVDVVDRRGNTLLRPMSAGHHENYESSEQVFYDGQAHAALQSYLASRAIWAGCGIVTAKGYELHQKASAIGQTTARKLTPTKHGNKLPYKIYNHRLEIRLGDGNRSPWAIRTKFGLTSFVLRLIEHDTFPDDLIVHDEMTHQMQSVSRNPSHELLTQNGPMTAAYHQQMIARACLDFAQKHPQFAIPADEIIAAESIEKIADEIDEVIAIPDNLYVIADRIDWAAKRNRMHEKGIKASSISTKNLDAVKADLEWEEIGNHTPAERWYQKCQPPLDPLSILRAKVTPPDGSASNRVQWLAANDLSSISLCEWDRIHHNVGPDDVPVVTEYFAASNKSTYQE